MKKGTIKFNIFIDKKYNWKKIETNSGTIYLAGELEELQKINSFSNNEIKFKSFLNKQRNHFSFIFKSKYGITAAVDSIRSFPIFYSFNKGNYFFSNSADTLRKKLKLHVFDQLGLKEYVMLGYTLSNRTLLNEIKQIPAGQFFNNKKRLNTYFSYIGKPQKKLKRSSAINLLDDQLNNVFKRLVKKIKEKKVFIPLSGGLDSRLVLAKLLEFGCKNISCFSYGLKNNFETKTARKVCKVLKIDLLELTAEKLNSQDLFQQKKTMDYINFANNLSSSPSFIDFYAIQSLFKKNLSDKNSVLINGQSGDFITGDHIPKEYTGDYSINELFKIIFQKHYSLWSKMKNKNLDLMSQQFNKEIDKVNFPDYEKKKYAFFSRHEYWEWVERQTKWVVNGQRVYDFFNLKWYLPLWEKTFIDYWQRMPYEYKVNQNLYREYLKKYNYKGIFDIPKAIPNPWTGIRKLLPIIVSILFSFNRKLKSDIYKKLYYHSTHKYLYEYFGKEDFLTNYRNSRSPQSFIVKALVNKILNKETLRRKNVIDF